MGLPGLPAPPVVSWNKNWRTILESCSSNGRTLPTCSKKSVFSSQGSHQMKAPPKPVRVAMCNCSSSGKHPDALPRNIVSHCGSSTSPRGASCEPKRPSFLRRVQNSNRPFESVPAPADNRSCGTARRGCIDSCRHFLHGICEVSGGGSGPRCATQSLARVAGAAYFFPEEPGAAGDAGKLARRRRVLRLGPQTLTHRGRVRARRPRPIAW